MGSARCEDCNPGIVPRWLGCVRPGEDVTLECSRLSLLASVTLVLLFVAAVYLGISLLKRASTFNRTDNKMKL